eukprot:403369485
MKDNQNNNNEAGNEVGSNQENKNLNHFKQKLQPLSPTMKQIKVGGGLITSNINRNSQPNIQDYQNFNKNEMDQRQFSEVLIQQPISPLSQKSGGEMMQESITSNNTKDEENGQQLRKTSQNFRIGKQKKNLTFLRSQLGSAGGSGFLQQLPNSSQTTLNQPSNIGTLQNSQTQLQAVNNIHNNRNSAQLLNMMSSNGIGGSSITTIPKTSNIVNNPLQQDLNFTEEVKQLSTNQQQQSITNIKQSIAPKKVQQQQQNLEKQVQQVGASPLSGYQRQRQLNELYLNKNAKVVKQDKQQVQQQSYLSSAGGGSSTGQNRLQQKIKQVNANFINSNQNPIITQENVNTSSQMKNRAQSLQNQTQQQNQLLQGGLSTGVFHTNSSYLKQEITALSQQQVLKPNQGNINNFSNKPITATRDNRNIATAHNFYSNKQNSTSVFFASKNTNNSNLQQINSKNHQATQNYVLRRGAGNSNGMNMGQISDLHSTNIQDQSDYSNAKKILDQVQNSKHTNKVLLNPISLKRGQKQDQQIVLIEDQQDAEEDQTSLHSQIELLKSRRIGSQQQSKMNNKFQHPQSQQSPSFYQNNNDQFALPRALKNKQNQKEQDLIHQMRSDRKDFDYDEKEDFHSQGIRIKINKERKVINHLNANHENTNLLFYNFNAYDDATGTSQIRQDSAMSIERVPTRGVKSRKEFRERQIQSASLQQHPYKFMQGSKAQQQQNQQQQTGKNWNISNQSTAANSISQKDRSNSNQSRHNDPSINTGVKQSTYLSEVNAYQNYQQDSSNQLQQSQQKQKSYFNQQHQKQKQNIQFYSGNSKNLEDHFVKQAILTSENYGKNQGRCFSSSNNQRSSYLNSQSQNNNSGCETQGMPKVSYNGPQSNSSGGHCSLGSKTTTGFRSLHSNKGPGGNFGRLTKINMKSVEDEIEEEMSSGEEEIFN